MGSGQIGGIATLMDIDFENAAGFVGKTAEGNEARFIVYYLSHALMFCTGALIEAHIVITPAVCTLGESREFEVIGGSHRFLENVGVPRTVVHICVHRGFNKSEETRNTNCSPHNIAIMILEEQYQFNKVEYPAEYVLTRIRYGSPRKDQGLEVKRCHFYGYGSRRNPFLVPLLIDLRKVEVTVLDKEQCTHMWNKEDHYLCISQFQCLSERFGSLCPDDMGSVIDCDGFIRGMMTARMIDRPCGVGFLDTYQYLKFLTCAVDGARDMIQSNDTLMHLANTPAITPSTTALTLANLTPDEDSADKADV